MAMFDDLSAWFNQPGRAQGIGQLGAGLSALGAPAPYGVDRYARAQPHFLNIPQVMRQARLDEQKKAMQKIQKEAAELKIKRLKREDDDRDRLRKFAAEVDYTQPPQDIYKQYMKEFPDRGLDPFLTQGAEAMFAGNSLTNMPEIVKLQRYLGTLSPEDTNRAAIEGRIAKLQPTGTGPHQYEKLIKLRDAYPVGSKNWTQIDNIINKAGFVENAGRVGGPKAQDITDRAMALYQITDPNQLEPYMRQNVALADEARVLMTPEGRTAVASKFGVPTKHGDILIPPLKRAAVPNTPGIESLIKQQWSMATGMGGTATRVWGDFVNQFYNGEGGEVAREVTQSLERVTGLLNRSLSYNPSTGENGRTYRDKKIEDFTDLRSSFFKGEFALKARIKAVREAAETQLENFKRQYNSQAVGRVTRGRLITPIQNLEVALEYLKAPKKRVIRPQGG